ncbi:hypothetical protein FRC96_19810 [Lujinxingia vulgaris]|uniref:Prolipoprotein diacylglyceryl transferase n=1 Tax=Lujinxingia vulgaris TaxID=2600176 RepID=A0A5C6X0Z0_9DELT|nr:hypothetical protein [Lujinxingia vulgaris]TXD31878.1 hypothetical protein FRC96_19810 [Lujinxingia vulgaris]
MELMVEAGGWPAGSAMIGVGVWVMFALWWRGLSREGERVETRLVSFGAMMGGGLVAGVGVGSWLGGGASSLGALLGAGVVGAAAWLTTTDTQRRADWLAAALVAGFAGLAVARIGCVFEGCDFGGVLPEGEGLFVQRHAAGTAAWELQVLTGQLGAGAAWSRPTLPFAPMMVATFALGALGTAIARRRWGSRSGGVAAVGSVTLALAACVELTRATESVSRRLGAIPWSVMLYAAGALTLALIALQWWRNGRRALRIAPE